MDAKGEVLITIMASLAQQESQSLSQSARIRLPLGWNVTVSLPVQVETITKPLFRKTSTYRFKKN